MPRILQIDSARNVIAPRERPGAEHVGVPRPVLLLPRHDARLDDATRRLIDALVDLALEMPR